MPGTPSGAPKNSMPAASNALRKCPDVALCQSQHPIIGSKPFNSIETYSTMGHEVS